MQFFANGHCLQGRDGLIRQIARIMRITAVLLLAACLQVSARSSGQNVTLAVQNVPLKKVFREIQRQTGLNVLVESALLEKAGRVTLNVHDMPVNEVLDICLRNEPFDYSVEAKAIVVKEKTVGVTQVAAPPTDAPPPPPPFSVHGRVTNEKGEPLAGVTVTVKGTKKAAATNANGEFDLSNIDEKATLVITGTNVETAEVKIGGRSQLMLSLKTKTVAMDEMVVVGYGSQKKASLTAAVSTVNAADMADIPASNLSNALAGRASGTFIQTPSGLPGTTSVVRIRASSSWNGGSPLFVIDGVVRDQASFDELDPTQIANISILKDAASAAIYGSRSSNGVVLVTTKTGHKGAPTVQYGSVFTVSSKPEIQMAYMGINNGITLYNQTHSTNQINQYDIDWLHKNNPDGKMYFDAAYQKPFSQKHTLNVSGGSDNVTYFVGGSLFDESGFLPQVKYGKYNVRGNVQVAITKDLSVGVNLDATNSKSNRFYSYLASDADLSGFYEKLFYIGSGFVPPYINGKPVYPGWAGGNPIEQMKNGGYQNTADNRLNALITAEYKVPFIKGLSAKVSYSNNGEYRLKKTFASKPMLYNFAKDPNSGIGQILTDSLIGSQPTGFPAQPFIGNDNLTVSSYQLNGYLTYDRMFGDHHINVMGVYEQYESDGKASSLYKYNFPVMPIDQFAFASQSPGNTQASGYEVQDARLSYIGRVNYDYAGRYLISASLRDDGSIKFAPGHRWGLFPSVSGGWVLSDENFFKHTSASKVLDFVKIRGSYGTTGNDVIGGWLWQELYNMSDTGYFAGTPAGSAPIIRYGGISNPNLTWESSASSNIGLDVHFLKNWNFTGELWEKHSYNILGQRIMALPIEFGASFPAVNYGIMNAKGVELQLDFENGRIGKNVFFAAGANFGLATTEVVHEDYAANALPADIPDGKPLNYISGYQATGIIRTQAQLNALPSGYQIFGATPQLGMLNFKDVGGPGGKPDGVINEYDKVVVAKYGSPTNAPISFGFHFNVAYKGFALNALFSGLAGYKIAYNDPWGKNYSGGIIVPAYMNDSYSASNPNGKFPEVFLSGDARANGYVVTSNFNTYSGNFIRLKNLNLSYSIAQNKLQKVGIKSLQVFAGGTNLFIIRKFKYYDPEVYSSNSYPAMTNATLGLNLKF